MNVIALGLLLAAEVLFLVTFSQGRRLSDLGLALFATAVALAAVWPQHLITIN